MDQNTLITVLGSTGAIILSMFGIFLLVRSEANNDRRQIQDIQREDRKDFLELLRGIHEEVKGIQLEIKDFHNRLCNIEQNRSKL